MKKYYFISYTWQRKSTGKWTPSNALTSKDPLQWQIDANEKFGLNEEYIILHWIEITKEQFKKYNEEI